MRSAVHSRSLLLIASLAPVACAGDAQPGASAEARAPSSARTAMEAVLASVRSYGLDLSDEDLATIRRFHRAFIRQCLDLRFRSHGRRPRYFHPTLREVLLQKDLDGRFGSYLARAEDFRFLREMQARDRIVPVVGDLAGDHPPPAVGQDIRRRGLSVTALHASNVEFYLTGRSGGFPRFAETVAGLPRDTNSVIVRSCFNRCTEAHPRSVPDHRSVQLLQRIDDFVDGWKRRAWSGDRGLVTHESLDLR